MGGVAEVTSSTADRPVANGGEIQVSGASLAAGMAGAVCAEAASRVAPHASTRRAARRKVPTNRRCLVGWAARGMAVEGAGAKSVVVMELPSLTPP